MDGDGRTSFLRGSASNTTGPNYSRGLKIALVVTVVFFGLVVVMMIMTFANTATNVARDANYQSLTQRIGYMSGLLSRQLTHAYTFTAVYDSVTMKPVTNPYEIFFGLESGAPPAIVKGRIELLFSSDGAAEVPGNSLVRYNMTIAHPVMWPSQSMGIPTSVAMVNGLELVVTTFNARTDHLVERTTVVLCGTVGGSSNSAHGVVCNPQGNKQDNFYGSGVLPSAFETILKADEMHTTLFLLVFMANSTQIPLANENVQFVVELDA